MVKTTIPILILTVSILTVFWADLAFGDLQTNADLFFEKGEKAFINKQFEKAISFYDKALVSDPNHINSLFKKGGTLLILGNSDEAIVMFDKVLELDPNHVDALIFKADELVRLGKSSEALPLYEQILRIDSGNTDALGFMADNLVKDGKIEDAKQMYENILKIEPQGEDPLGASYAEKFLNIAPNNPDALSYMGNSLVMLERSKEGNTIIISNKLGEAISYFDKALAIEPDHLEALFNKGRAIIQEVRASEDDPSDENKLNEGISYINRVLEINPNHVGALNFKADELLRFDRNSEAKPIIDKVLELEPDNVEALFLKGRTFVLDENWYDALTYFDEVLQINPANNIAKTNFRNAIVLLGTVPLDGYLDVKVHDSHGGLVSNIRVSSLKLVNHELGTNLIDSWPVTQTVTRNDQQYEVRQLEKSIDVKSQYVFGGASHYGIRYHYDLESWLLYGNYWQYYVDPGDSVTFVYTAFRPAA